MMAVFQKLSSCVLEKLVDKDVSYRLLLIDRAIGFDGNLGDVDVDSTKTFFCFFFSTQHK